MSADSDSVTFEFDGRNYRVDARFLETEDCVLPDGRVVTFDGYEESVPRGSITFLNLHVSTLTVYNFIPEIAPARASRFNLPLAAQI